MCIFCSQLITDVNLAFWLNDQTILNFSCVPYVPDPENTNLLKTAMGIYRKFDKYPEALRCAIQLNDMATVEEIFSSCKDL